MSAVYFKIFLTLMKKLRKLESYKDYMTIKDGIPNADFFSTNNLGVVPNIPQIKHLDVMYSASKEWYFCSLQESEYTLKPMKVTYGRAWRFGH